MASAMALKAMSPVPPAYEMGEGAGTVIEEIK
jgi:hypothetical protein